MSGEALKAALALCAVIDETYVQTYQESWGSPAEMTHIDPDEWRAIVTAAKALRDALSSSSSTETEDRA